MTPDFLELVDDRRRFLPGRPFAATEAWEDELGTLHGRLRIYARLASVLDVDGTVSGVALVASLLGLSHFIRQGLPPQKWPVFAAGTGPTCELILLVWPEGHNIGAPGVATE